MVKNLPAMQETRVRSLGWEDPLEKTMATYSSILAWWIPWTEEPGKLQSMRLQRVRHDWVTNTHTHIHMRARAHTHTHTHTHTHRHRELRGIPDGSVSIDLIFSIVFLVSIIFTSALIFVISFLPLNLGFICSTFSSSLRCEIRLFI